MAETQVPKDKKNLRACLLCSLIKSSAQFKKYGCENCDEILRLKGNAERINECTSTVFDGMVALLKPDQSWVAKWQRLREYVPGLYALRVTGRVPDDVEYELSRRNILYRPRDGTVNEFT